jgi:NADH:ubiquinone oxidoreductase subunit 6 (subunit J)
MLYAIGAWQIAAIELSVGAGLVTVLLVFAITMVGNEREAMVARRLPLLLVIVGGLLLITLTVPFMPVASVGEQQPLSDMLWQERGLDLVLQIALIFSGVLGVIGLLSAAKNTESILQDFSAKQDTETLPASDFDRAEKEAA